MGFGVNPTLSHKQMSIFKHIEMWIDGSRRAGELELLKSHFVHPGVFKEYPKGAFIKVFISIKLTCGKPTPTPALSG